MNKPLISVISPVYNAGKIVSELVKRIEVSISKISMDYEIILVDDGSTDNSWQQIETICSTDPKVKGVKLSKNFGQHYAITAGLYESKGDFVIVMDCDLQDNPNYIELLYQKALEGNDIVYTYKKTRKHSFFKNITAQFFFKLFNFLTDDKNKYADKSVGSFSLLSRKTVDAFKQISDFHRHYLLILRNLGFKSTYVEIIHEQRFEGKSSYTLNKLIRHAMDGITSQSDKLLRISINIGFLMFLISVIWAIVIVISYFRHGSAPGYTSMMAIILLSTGLILMSIGILGIYIGKIFEQVKQRPLYFIDKKLNF